MLFQVEKEPQFVLRGLPTLSKMDQLYSLNDILHNGRRQFVGPSGWTIRWHESRWVLDCQGLAEGKAMAETNDYPIGSLSWTIQERNTSFLKTLTLTACSGNKSWTKKGTVTICRTWIHVRLRTLCPDGKAVWPEPWLWGRKWWDWVPTCTRQ